MSDTQSDTPVIDAPNIIDDTLPGGARWIWNLGDEPVWVETKSQLREEMAKRGLVQAETKAHNPHDQSPWATRTRLKAGAVDPFLPKAQPRIEPPPPAETILYDPEGKPITGTTVLDYATASTCRGYFSWAVRAGYEPELFCASCFDHSRQSHATYEINEQDIDIWCRCRRIVYTGHTRFSKIAPTLPPSVSDDVVTLGPAQITLSLPEVQILREWKSVLRRFGLLEGLRCNLCFEANRADGVSAAVTPAQVRIACRCRVYTFVGYSY